MNIEKNDIQQIKALLTVVLQVDFFPYKNSTVMRRVEKRMKVFQFTETKEYVDYLEQHKEELKILGEDIFINVTDFFRDPHVFQKIKHKILPSLFTKNKQAVKVWVAGCATGEEAYSFAILIKEFCEENGYKHKIKIIATDIKEEAVNKARQGLYTVKEILGVNQKRLRNFFDREGDKYRIKKQIRSEVIFAIHDMTSDPPFARVDLLSCRNLLIYLDKENQKKVLSNLVFALNIEGFLVLGKSETAIDLAYDLKNISSAYKIYKRIKTTRTTRRLNFDITYQDSLLPVLVPPNENEESMKEHELAKSFQHIIHQKYAPAVVIIDEQLYVKHITRSAKQYIDTPEDFTKIYSLLDLAPEAITAVVRAAIAEIKKGKKRSVYPILPVTYVEIKQLSVTVEPLEVTSDDVPFYAILFEENRSTNKSTKDIANRINLALQNQLADTEENLRKTIGKLENTNQNLLASNEELQSTNEEYISVNEELQTINSEYQDTISELSVSNKDVDHLLQSTDIGTVFLDDKLDIRKFTNPIKNLINIDDIDLKRPLKNFTHNLKNINIYKEVKAVLDGNQAIEKEVVSDEDIHYLMRATPYDVDEEDRKGIVLSFINIQKLIEAEQALTESELLYRSVFNYANDGIVLVDENEQKVSNVNQRQLEILGYTKEEYLKTAFRDVFTKIQSDGQTIEGKVKRYAKIKDTHHAVEWTLKKKDNTLIETEISTVNMPPPYEGYTLNIIRDVTQRKKAQAEILASQKRFEAVFDNCPIGVGISDMKFNIIRVNKAFGRMTGHTPKQLSRMSFIDITYYEDRKPDMERLQMLMSDKKKIITFEKRYVKKNGDVFWARLWVSVMDDGSGEKFFVSSMRDITKEKEAAKKLQDSELRYRSLFEKNIDAVLLYDIKNHKALSANKSACKLFDCSKKYLLEHMPTAFMPEFQENGETTIQFYDRQTQKYIRTGEIRYFAQLQTKKGKPIEVEATAFRLHDSPDSDMVIQFKNITEQKNAQNALEYSELRYRSLFEKNIEAALIYDVKNNKILSANKSAAQLFDCSKKYLLEHTPMDFFPEFQENGEPSMQFFGKQIQNYAQTGEIRHFMQLLTKKGKTIEVEITAFPLDDSPDSEMVVQFRNITEQKTAQKALQESEARFRSVYENSGEAILIKDLTQQKVTQFNSKFTEMTGYTEEDFEKLGGADITLEPQADGRSAYVHHEEHMQVLKETGYCFVENWLLIHKDGHIIHTNMSLSKLYDDRDDAIVLQFRDITEQYKAQQALKESEEQFRNLFENSAIGIGVFDVENMTVVDCNQQFAALHGHSIAEFKKVQPQDITAEIQADGRDSITHLQEQIATVMKNGSLTVNNWLCKRKDGTIFHTEVTLNILNENTPNIIFVHMHDITEKLTAQKALQGSEQQFRSLFEHSADAVTIIDSKKYVFLDTNKKSLEMFGYSKEELMTKTPKDLSATIQADGRSTSEHIKELVATVKKYGYYSLDNWINKRADGTEFYTEVSVTNLPAPNEHIFIIQRKDITERLEAQQEIQRINTILANADDVIGMVSMNSKKIIYLNSAGQKKLGRSVEKLENVSPYDFFSEQEAERMVNLIIPHIAKFGTWQGEIHITDKFTQEEYLISTNIIGHFSDDEQLEYISGIARDVTEQRKRANVLHAITSYIAEAYNEDLFPAIVRSITEGFELTGCAICKAANDGGYQDIIAMYFDGKYETGQLPCYKMPCAKIYTEGTQIYTKDVQKTFPVLDDYFDPPIESYIGIPIYDSSNTIIAHIAVFDREPLEKTDFIQTSLQIYASRIGADLERAEKEKALQKQKDYLRTIIDLSPNYIFSKNKEGQFVLANKALASIYGTTPDGILGKTDTDFNPNKEEVEFFMQKDREVIENAEMIYIPEEIVTTASGESMILRTTKIPVFNESGNCEQMLGIAVDITESKQIERDLRESQVRFKAVFENSYSIIAVVDAQGNLIEQNKPLRVDGSILDMVGKPIWKSEWFFHDKKVMAQVEEDFKKVMKGEYIVNQCTYLRTPDNIGHMSYSGKPVYLEEGGELLFILAEARDITDLMLAQKELGLKVDELNTKNEELKKYIDSNMQLENFAYITSHDLREPLRTISGFANLLERKYADKLDDTAEEYLSYIITSTKNMNALIEDLLIFSRVHTSEHKVEEIDLNDLLEQVRKSIGRSIQETGADVQFKNIPKAINANETKMKQLFQNLISNAIKFRKPDAAPEVIVSAKSKGKFWEFTIEDNGIGIKKEYYDKIFMIFKRLHTKDEYEGTGIGLSLCKKIVEQHGGKIHLESMVGEGTKFYFTIEK